MQLELHGHRGARGRFPENTLASFAYAISQGVHALELDVGLTRDAQVVVLHDPKLNPHITRDAHGQWLREPTPRICELTLEQIKRYDVGRIDPSSSYAQTFDEQQAVDGSRAPTLDELLDLMERAKNHQTLLNIEVKVSPETPHETPAPEVMADAVLSVLARREALHRVIVQSFDWRVPRRVQAVAPTVSTAYLTIRQTDENTVDDPRGLWLAGFKLADHRHSLSRTVAATGGKIWAPYYRDLSSHELNIAHDLGLRVIVWTVNRAEEMRRMIALGVDGIISDYPDRLREVAAEQHVELPAPTPVCV